MVCKCNNAKVSHPTHPVHSCQWYGQDGMQDLARSRGPYPPHCSHTKDLKIVVVRARRSDHAPDPLFYIAGGPGKDIETIARFYQGHSSRQGALNDGTHTVGAELLKTVQQPTLVIHSREDNSVPFGHAEWSLEHIPHAELCEAGITGHFLWVDPDFEYIRKRLDTFLTA